MALKDKAQDWAGGGMGADMGGGKGMMGKDGMGAGMNGRDVQPSDMEQYRPQVEALDEQAKVDLIIELAANVTTDEFAAALADKASTEPTGDQTGEPTAGMPTQPA
jgi:hypothetical protein